MAERQFWDACCWIDYVNEGGDLSKPMTALWQAVGSSVELVVNPIILCETLLQEPGSPLPWPDPQDADQIFDAKGVLMAQIDRRTGERARSLRRRYRLKAPDAIHLATCLINRIDTLFTRDASHLLKLGPNMERDDGGNLRITTPEGAAGPLFDG